MSRDTPIDAIDFPRFVRHLAPYRPFSSGADQRDYALRQLILAAAHENGGRITCDECQFTCKTFWGLDLELEEIYASMQELESEGQLQLDDDHYALSESSRADLAERLRSAREVEATAFEEWESVVRRIAPSLGAEQMGNLRDDLTAWIYNIIRSFGIEAALLLYPDQERCKRLLEDIKALSPDFLPPRDDSITIVRQDAFAAFLDKITPTQRKYLNNLITTAYFMSVFTLEPEALGAVRHLTVGQVIFLDTNVVYPIFGLSGPRAFHSTLRVLALSRELGYKVCVTPWTVTEMRESVRNARSKRPGKNLSTQASTELLERLALTDDADVFVKAYHHAHRDTPINYEDFLALHEQIVPLLEKHDIRVVDNGCRAIDNNKDAVSEQIVALGRVPGGAAKLQVLREHDAKHRLLIEKLRGDGRHGFSNAGYIFLTNDGVLIRYAKEGVRRPSEPPFAVSVNNWANIMRALSPRTDDFDGTLVDLLDNPAVFGSGVVSQREIIEAIGRVDMYERQSDAIIGARVLLDTAIAHDEQEPTPTDAGPSAKTDAAESLHEEVRALGDQLDQERKARIAVEYKLQMDLESARRERLEAEHQLKRLSVSDASARKPDSSSGSGSETELKARLARQERLVRMMLAVAISAVGIVALVVPLVAKWVTGTWLVAADVCVCVAIPVVAFAWLHKRKEVGTLVLCVSAIIVAIVAVHGVVTS